MNDSIIAFNTLPPRLLRRYLVDNGWRVKSYSKRNVELFTLAGQHGEHDIEILLPASEGVRATTSAVRDALATLSQLQDRDVAEVIRDVRSVASDVIQSTIPDQYVYQDSIELHVAREFTKGFREFLASAATTELKPDPFFKRVSKEGLDYADKCRFGHTFRGSFGFRIESPIGLNDEPTIDGFAMEIPFERRVVERVARGLQAVSEAYTVEDPSIIVARFETGLSANMCDELVSLIQKTGVDSLGLAISFSKEWRPSVEETATKFFVRQNHLPILEQASTDLRRKEPPKEATVVGRVRSLQTDANPSDLLQNIESREVDIVWDSDEYGLIRVHVSLDPKDYLEAVEAHKLGTIVTVAGFIQQQGRKWVLMKPHGFRLIDI